MPVSSTGSLSRRHILQLLAAGVTAANLKTASQLLAQVQAGETYQPAYFTPQEFSLVDLLSEMIIPADEHSPGARAARVADYIDLVLSHSDPVRQGTFRSKLNAFIEEAQAFLGKPFTEADEGSRAAFLNKLATNAASPRNLAEQFFVEMKQLVIFGYYTSEIGLLQELGYQGNQALPEFPGCTESSAPSSA